MSISQDAAAAEEDGGEEAEVLEGSESQSYGYGYGTKVTRLTWRVSGSWGGEINIYTLFCLLKYSF